MPSLVVLLLVGLLIAAGIFASARGFNLGIGFLNLVGVVVVVACLAIAAGGIVILNSPPGDWAQMLQPTQLPDLAKITAGFAVVFSALMGIVMGGALCVLIAIERHLRKGARPSSTV